MKIYTSYKISTEIDRLVKKDPFTKSFRFHYLFIINHIRTYHFFYKKYAADNFVPVNIRLLRELVSYNHAHKFLRILVEAGILETDGTFKQGIKSIGYRVTEKYRSGEFYPIDITDSGLKKKISDKTDDAKNEITHRNDAYSYVTQCMDELTIDCEKSHAYISENIKDRDKRYSYLMATDLFKDKFVTVDDNGRLHNNLTNLPSRLRPFVTYKGDLLVQVDIKNSQPLFLYTLMKETYFIPDNELEKYKKVVCDYGFYEFFAEKLSFDLREDNRKEFKRKIFTGVLFDRNRDTLSKYEQVFKQEFPMIYRVVREIKTGDHSGMAAMLQQIESKFIFGCVDRIRAVDDIPVFTIHDSICTAVGNELIVEKVVRKRFHDDSDLDVSLNVKKFD